MRTRTRPTTALRLLVAGAAALATILGGATGAGAHVTVHATEAPSDSGTMVIAFRVPNERTDGATTKVGVAFPRDHPIVSATVRPKPGWTATVTRMPISTPVVIEGSPISTAIDVIEWSGGQIGVGQYDEFEVDAGPFPSGSARLLFPTVQTYDKGAEVAWIEPSTAGGPEPEKPAPALPLGATAPASSPAAAPTVTAAPTTATTAEHDMAAMAPAAPTDLATVADKVDGTRTLAVIAVVLAALALAGVLLALLVPPGRTPPPEPAPEPGEPASTARP
jgi:periplasmic copper chaperone A